MIFMMGLAVPAIAETLGDDGVAPSTVHIMLSDLVARRLQVTQDRPACSADLNADGVVATDDLLYLLASYGRRSADCVPPTYLDLNRASAAAHLHRTALHCTALLLRALHCTAASLLLLLGTVLSIASYRSSYVRMPACDFEDRGDLQRADRAVRHHAVRGPERGVPSYRR